jgi:dihydroneopterin aldolase
VTNDIQLGFAHPIERSHADCKTVALDRIMVRDYTVDVDIGAFQHERGVVQRIRFNVVVEVMPSADELGDDVDLIMSYDTITEAIDAELAHERLNLLETLAERIAARVLKAPLASRVFVRIEKLDRGPWVLGFEIVRDKQTSGDVTLDGDITRPQIIYVPNVEKAAVHLTSWVDQLERRKAPIIFCVGLPDTPRLRVTNRNAQRTIDLLSIDQNAWAFASFDPRVRVVATKTEMDWAAKRNFLAVWAPSKMILDAVSPPDAQCEQAHEFAIWLAHHVQADGVTCFDCPTEMDASIPLKYVGLDLGGL